MKDEELLQKVDQEVEPLMPAEQNVSYLSDEELKQKQKEEKEDNAENWLPPTGVCEDCD
jgi:hypothetical protein